MRDAESRLTWYRNHVPSAPGMCAEHVRLALQVPMQGLSDAVRVLAVVPPSEMRRSNAPRGSVVYWSGGQDGHGHVCFALGGHTELSVDVGGPGTLPAPRPFVWFERNWPQLHYVGWSWYFGRLCTAPHGST